MLLYKNDNMSKIKQNTERDSNVNRAFVDLNYFECHTFQVYYRNQDNSGRLMRGFR